MGLFITAIIITVVCVIKGMKLSFMVYMEMVNNYILCRTSLEGRKDNVTRQQFILFK